MIQLHSVVPKWTSNWASKLNNTIKNDNANALEVID